MKVLLVDDSNAIAMAVGQMLKDAGHDVVRAIDGEDAVNIVEQDNNFDVVLLDWNMPVMNGLDFLRALRREERGKEPVVVFCTNENDPEHISEAIRAGANEYIMKPFDREIVEAKFFARNGPSGWYSQA